ncbi:putative tubulin polyglutamylase ttll-15 [Ciona intestinalis]
MSSSISLLRCIKNNIRSMRISSYRIQYLVIATVFLGFYLLFSQVMEIKNLQKKQLHALDAKQFNVNPVQSNTAVASSKPKYWLAAKSADTPHMEHVRNVFKAAGFDRWDTKTGTWNVMWSYDYPFPSKVSPSNLKPNQLINHFPGSGYLTSKVYLASSKSRYIPTAFQLPKDKEDFKKHVQDNPDKLWVQKNNQHRGITIKAMKELNLDASNSFVQEFVKDPLLVDGKKFDIGIYTVITSVDPLRVYVYKGEWLIRYCPEPYLPLDVNNPNKYVVADDYTPTWEMPSLRYMYTKLHMSHKNSLLEFIRTLGRNPEKLEADVYSAVAEIIREKQNDIKSAGASYPYGSESFFELVRFDFVLGADLKVYLMEVNMSPNLSSAHFDANAVMYEQVVFNTLTLAGVATRTSRIGLKSPGSEKNIDVQERDISVYDTQCIKCENCDTDICKLCAPCLSHQLQNDLTTAYLEHTNKVRSQRVIPPPMTPEHTEDFSNLPERDRLTALWFKGMCLKDTAWCN